MGDGDIQTTCFALMDHIRGIRALEPEVLKCGIDQVCQELLARVDAGPGRRSERMALAADGEKLRALTGEDHGPW